ncbi:Sec7-domain-containing protein [Ceraceosorus guamensis]|uniref:Sec7-domain-containing protein n=1 Tax=Ceraceosorus guamensis TaxID=1522189 RepID=A0A316VQH0_9BASI|nr:Sec7-domain-containing protein [Ceraceosorus guamensis]PWN39308.1 Sec7-domain-containing protein [Ceraceosorus guamensis]
MDHGNLATSSAPLSDVGAGGVQLDPLHLLHSEITTVTSALRKQLRVASSSSFLGSSSNSSTTGAGAIAPGTTSASLTRAAVAAAVASLEASTSSATDGAASSNGLTPATSPSARLTASAARPISSLGSVNITRQSAAYAGDRDESLPGLLNGFTVLRAQLRAQQTLGDLPLLVLLAPFLRVILSPRTTGPITSAALQAVHRLLLYRIIKLPANHLGSASHSSSSFRAAQSAVAEIAHAVSHCRFEASDAAADELVLLRILAVMRELVCGDANRASGKEPLANILGDESICEMVETGLSMCCQTRLSDLLRKTAEQSMIAMARTLFSRLHAIPTTDDEAFAGDDGMSQVEPEHATLAADPVGEDKADDEKRMRRMTMPDPKSVAVPAAAAATLQELKAIGEAEADEEAEEEEEVGKAKGDAALPSDARSGHESQDSPKHVAGEEHPTSADLVNSDQMDILGQVEPYGLPAIKEVLRVIISLLDPHNAQHTDTMRLLGLSMLCSIFEVSANSIARFPTLRASVQDSACKYLFQLTRSDHPIVLTLSLRAIAIIFETMREQVKLQSEYLLDYLLDRLAPTFPLALEPWSDEALPSLSSKASHPGAGRASSGKEARDGKQLAVPPPPPPPPQPRTSERAPATGEARELLLETLGLICRTHRPDSQASDSDIAVELWANFDCDVDCENLYEHLIRFLCRAIYASNPLHPNSEDSTQLFALDLLLTLVSHMSARQEALIDGSSLHSESHRSPSVDVQALSDSKIQKAELLAGAARFNAKPKDGLTFLQAQGLIDTSGRDGLSKAESIARFLKTCPRLDKKLLGDYISRPDNIEVLEAFIGLFDFRDKPVADAMREMLETFRLPGESQQINRITETFAKFYFAASPPEIRSEDAVYVLAYSIIMLNTDLHSPQNRSRMTAEDYRRNLRGVNDGKDFDIEYLGTIYDSIRKREIVMPEEHVGQLGFDYTWKEILRRARTAGRLVSPVTSAFDKAMFTATWRPIVASIAHAFSSFHDELLLERAISGFRQCAILAGTFDMGELFDFMLQGLASASGLLDGQVPGGGALTNNAQVEVDGQAITVSPLSVRFGANFKGQLAAVVLFTIAQGNAVNVRTGWSPIFEMLKNMFVSSLLPSSMSQMQDFASPDDVDARTHSVPIPLKPRKSLGPSPQDPRAQGGGLFSTLSSYLLSPYSSAQEPAAPDVTAEDVESSLCTLDCIASCRIDELWAQILRLDGPNLLPALHAVRDLADKTSIDQLRAANADPLRRVQDTDQSSSGRSTPTSHIASAGSTMRRQLAYEPASVFVLEILTTTACSADDQAMQEAWNIASGHISVLLQAPLSHHPMLIERAVVSLLRLIERVSPLAEGALRDQIFVALDSLRSIPQELRQAVSSQLIAGLAQVLRSDPGFARSQTEWSLVLSLVTDQGATRNARSARRSISIIRQIAEERLMNDNFENVIHMLQDFALNADCTGWRAEEARSGQRRTLTEKKELAEYETVCQERGLEAIEVLASVRTSIPRLLRTSRLPPSDAWCSTWISLMLSLAAQCVNGHRPARQAALTHLQRTVLAEEVLQDADPAELPLAQIFTIVLFPTLEELLKPAIYKKDPDLGPGGMQETRMRACALTCKAFLHYLSALAPAGIDEGFKQLWLQLLDLLDRFMHASKKDQLTEAIPENLKNVLLVMQASNLLVRPADANIADARTPQQSALWTLTADRLGRFMPTLLDDVLASHEPREQSQGSAVRGEAEPEDAGRQGEKGTSD